jgi:hypothetical protein
MIKYFLGLAAIMLSLNACATAPISYFSVTVVDENTVPVEGATVQGYFTGRKRGDAPSLDRKSITDADGKATISGPAIFYVNVDVSKEGYYKSKKQIPVNIKKDQGFTVLLRSKHNPIAMYAKKIKLNIPERKREYGFDFLNGDLVSTDHNGSLVDLKIRFDRNLVDNNNFTQSVTLSFANPTDGVIEMKANKEWKISDFKTPYSAPLDGYVPNIKLIYSRGSSGVTRKNVNIPFFMRIRSSVDKDGNINEAYYCKIWSGIKLYGVLADRPSIEMTYYCNPTPNDRNIEFNPKQNLLKNLKHEEEVGTP